MLGVDAFRGSCIALHDYIIFLLYFFFLAIAITLVISTSHTLALERYLSC
jgi:hypothetical protein